jgi:hypothetical protein
MAYLDRCQGLPMQRASEIKKYKGFAELGASGSGMILP